MMPHPVNPGRPPGELTATGFEGWSDAIRADFTANAYNYVVGSVLLSETPHVRVWAIQLAPGERLGAHRHCLDYFWTALGDGESIQHNEDGTTRYVRYEAGQTHHFEFAAGQRILHDLENIGSQPLRFITVEHKPPAPLT